MILDKLQQFGALHFLRRALLAVVRPLWHSETFLVLVFPNFPGTSFIDHRIVELTPRRVVQLAGRGVVSSAEEAEFTALVAEGSRGVGCLVGDVLAGYAWVQPGGGVYRYGKGGWMTIPANCTVMKNMLVRPSFRGVGFGRVLNQASMTLIPIHNLAASFIVYDNRIAINNRKAYGFRPALAVTQRSYLGGQLCTRVEVLANYPGVPELAQAVREGVKAA